MNSKKIMKKLSLILVSAVLMFIVSVGSLPPKEASAHNTAGHSYHSVEYETTYADPNDTSAGSALAISLVAVVPGIGGTLSTILGYLGLAGSFASWANQDTGPSTRYVITKTVYKADTTTSSYWGYYQIDIYNADTRETIYGEHRVIGKTGY